MLVLFVQYQTKVQRNVARTKTPSRINGRVRQLVLFAQDQTTTRPVFRQDLM